MGCWYRTDYRSGIDVPQSLPCPDAKVRVIGREPNVRWVNDECIGVPMSKGAVRPGEEEGGSCWRTEIYRKLAGKQRWGLAELGAGRVFVCLFALAFGALR